MLTCQHGTRVIRNGASQKGPWSAAFCPTPKGTADQCPPVWLDESGNPKAPSQKAVAAQTSAEQTAILREINNTLTMMFSWMKLKSAAQNPNIGIGQEVRKPTVNPTNVSNPVQPPAVGYVVPAPQPEEDLSEIPF